MKNILLLILLGGLAGTAFAESYQAQQIRILREHEIAAMQAMEESHYRLEQANSAASYWYGEYHALALCIKMVVEDGRTPLICLPDSDTPLITPMD